MILRLPRHGDGPALVALYQHAFRRHGSTARSAIRQIRGEAVVAEIRGEIVGLGCIDRIADDDVRALHPLLAALEPSSRALLAPSLEVELPFRVEAPPGLTVAVGPDDWLLTALVVREGHRRQGIGTAIALARLALARESASPGAQVFVHCVAGAGSRGLYEKLDFVPLVTKDRHYPGGAGMTLLYRPL
ncbi:MAG: GNAT family N-acetyltransferase [Alphaproteobacteria bacterium]|nr:GNAT family N-acetyltransferase [Alphaproteobacteria bacterium]